MLGTGFVLVTLCLGYSLPRSTLPNSSCPAFPHGRRLTAMDSNLSSFVLWLPVGFVQWAAQQEIKRWEEGEAEIVLPCPLPLGCCSSSVTAWLEPCLTVGAASPVEAPLLCEPSYLWEPLFSGCPSCETLQWESLFQLSSDSRNPSTFPWSLQHWRDNCFCHCQPLRKIPLLINFSSKFQ